MQAPPEFGFEQLVSELLRGLADTVADRPGQTEAQRFARHRAAIFSIMAFLPRDAMETMVAGQCVMFDHLLRDAVSDVLRGEAGVGKLRLRSQVIGLGRSFLKHLDLFGRLRARPGQDRAAPRRPEQDVSGVPTPMPEAIPAVNTVAAPAPAGGEPPTAPAPALLPRDAPPPAGETTQPQQPGFQNRRMRRALQFKHPAGKAGSGRTPKIVQVTQPAPRFALA